ncbi:hypothetical protein ACLOJK_013857 [Asimina triloba]
MGELSIHQFSSYLLTPRPCECQSAEGTDGQEINTCREGHFRAGKLTSRTLRLLSQQPYPHFRRDNAHHPLGPSPLSPVGVVPPPLFLSTFSLHGQLGPKRPGNLWDEKCNRDRPVFNIRMPH